MNEALKNIFAPAATVTSCVTVRRRIAAGQYEVEDSSGRLTVVAADAEVLWPATVSVVVQNGRIVGPGHRLGKHRVVAV